MPGPAQVGDVPETLQTFIHSLLWTPTNPCIHTSHAPMVAKLPRWRIRAESDGGSDGDHAGQRAPRARVWVSAECSSPSGGHLFGRVFAGLGPLVREFSCIFSRGCGYRPNGDFRCPNSRGFNVYWLPGLYDGARMGT